jgi:hypothetical protein
MSRSIGVVPIKRERVDSLPSGLLEPYEELVKRLITRRTPAELRTVKSMPIWACFAQRPLALDEFRAAPALDGWGKNRHIENYSKHREDTRIHFLGENKWIEFEL